jgi:Family of unknown function (DUF6077)
MTSTAASEARNCQPTITSSWHERQRENSIERLPNDLPKPAGMDRVIPTFIMAYAAWTVYVHALTAAHASFDTLVHWLPLFFGLAIVAIWRWFKLPARTDQLRPCAVAAREPTRAIPHPLAILVLAVLWVALLVVGGHYVLFWWGSVIALGMAWISTIDTAPCSLHREPFNNRLLPVVLIVALAAVCVTLIANRPDADDAFYQSIPATLLRLPKQPILLHDTIYRLANLPIQLPVYRIHSYEVLIGALSRVIGTQPAVIAYLVLPPVFSALSVIAWAQLLRLLAPKHWALVLVILFLCVLALGETPKSYGNFAFVRMFQGKAILASFIVPSIVYLSLEYSRQGTMRSWIALFSAQIAAIGITSSALFVAPAAAGLALVSAWSANALATRRLGLGILASSYVFVTAGVLASITHGGEGFVSSIALPPMTSWLEQTLGPWSTALLLATLLASWAFTEGRAQARVLLTSSLCFLLTVLNPYTYQFVADHFTNPSTYWRLFWALPLPFLLAIMLSYLLRSAIRLKPKLLAIPACLALTAAAAVFFFHSESLRKDNYVSLGVPSFKVPPLEYSVAKQLALAIPESGTILAPESIATWLPTFVVHPELLASRRMYLTGTFGLDEGKRRFDLQQYVAGTERLPNAPSELKAALARYALTAIVVTHAAPWQTEIAQIMLASGWYCSRQGSYDIWTKTSIPIPDERMSKGLAG